jgi:hypothetical protein
VEGVALRVDERTFSCGPCPRCGRVEPVLEALEPYGISRDRDGAPVLILFHCSCRTSRSLLWGDAPEVLRRKAEEWSPSKGGDWIR